MTAYKGEYWEQIGDEESFLFKQTFQDDKLYTFKARTVDRGFRKLAAGVYGQENWLRPMVQYLNSVSPDEKIQVFAESATSLKLKDINHKRIEIGPVSYEVHGKMSRQDIVAAYEAAVLAAEEKFLQSGKLAKLNKRVQAKNEAEAEKAEQKKKAQAEMLAVVEEKVKDEKLDLKGHDIWFNDVKQSADPTISSNAEVAERWGKLMQIEMRKNFGLLTPKIIMNTFKEASLGQDHWFDSYRDAYSHLVLGWKHGKALVTLTNPSLLIKAVKLRRELANEGYVQNKREETLKSLAYKDYSNRSNKLIEDGVDYLEEKEKYVRETLEVKQQKMNDSGHSDTGQIDDRQRETARLETAAAKFAMLKRQNAENAKVQNVSRQGADYLQEKADYIRQRLKENNLQMGDTGNNDGTISDNQKKTGNITQKTAKKIMKARKDRMSAERE